MIKTLLILFIYSLGVLSSFAQSSPFNIEIEPIEIPELGGLQSFAFAQDNGKWLIVGGSLDGLHQRQPFAAFDIAGHNIDLLVVDVESKQVWRKPLSSLPSGIKEQLSSTNMEFFKEGEYLYCVGGYGYSATEGDHTTYANMTAIKVSELIDAIINDTDITPFFRQIYDEKFQVTGGRLRKINDNFYLIGGQKFLGRYNPMGPSHGPGFIQEYTDAVHVFSINDNGTDIQINHIETYSDTDELHRRDNNSEPQILPNGEEGLTIFSGVFQHDENLPFLNCVNIDKDGYTVNNDFQQFYNHYHCAALPLYSSENNEMHTVFFGGIAQYYNDNGTLVQDDDVPFVKTIARVSRDKDGIMTEHLLPIEMPTLLGAGSEFIINKELPHFSNEVLKLDEITGDKVLLGYIYGGISSTAPNIFFTNTGEQSSASSQIFKVYLTKTVSTHQLNNESTSSLKVKISPNPNNGEFKISYYLKEATDVNIEIYDNTGKKLSEINFANQKMGEQNFQKDIGDLTQNGVIFIHIKTEYEMVTRKIIVQ